MGAAIWCVAGLVVCSLPFWLPSLVVRVRNRVFVSMNGSEGLELPGGQHGTETMRFLYSHPAANYRLRQPGVGLSDLFAYFLSPAHEIHQEHVETVHPHYARVASASRSILGVPKADLRALARKHTESLVASDPATGALRREGWQLLRLEELFFRAFVRVMYELVFREMPTAEAEAIVVAGATNVIRTLKWTARRDMAARDKLTAHVEGMLQRGCCDWIMFDEALSLRERALYIQGVHLVTGVVQLSEGMSHLFVALAQHPAPERVPTPELASVPAVERGNALRRSAEYMDRAITESLRVWPLFGIAHRITAAPITLPSTGEIIPTDTVLCFNFQKYQHDARSFPRPAVFDPSRWLAGSGVSKRSSSYIPFGVAANRPCPAQRMSLVIMHEAALVFDERVQVHTPISHSRSLPCRGRCLATLRSPADTEDNAAAAAAHQPPVGRWFVCCAFTWITATELVHSTWRSLLQLSCMVHSVREARSLRLAQRIFEDVSHPLSKAKATHDDDDDKKKAA